MIGPALTHISLFPMCPLLFSGLHSPSSLCTHPVPRLSPQGHIAQCPYTGLPLPLFTKPLPSRAVLFWESGASLEEEWQILSGERSLPWEHYNVLHVTPIDSYGGKLIQSEASKQTKPSHFAANLLYLVQVLRDFGFLLTQSSLHGERDWPIRNPPVPLGPHPSRQEWLRLGNTQMPIV